MSQAPLDTSLFYPQPLTLSWMAYENYVKAGGGSRPPPKERDW
mgnify:CR=1 FL=1